MNDPTIVKGALARLAEGETLTEGEAYDLMDAIMGGQADTAEITGILMGLRVRGETVEEITGFARAMRDRSDHIHPKSAGRIVDTCGTGGAKIKTFNCSTGSAFVAAGAGVTVAKHGNRSVTSPCGSADILEALGADLTLTPLDVKRIVEDVGVGFLFAPSFHRAMKHAIPARKALGVRTVFNVLGPLTNPAGADAQVMGVFSPDLVAPLAEVLGKLGTLEAMVVHGEGGLDEVSTLGPTRVMHLRDGRLERETLTPTTLGLLEARAEDISGLPPPAAAQELLHILKGGDGARRDFILLNAACAIVVGGKALDVRDGIDKARTSIESGAAYDKLEAYVTATGGRLRGAS